MLVILLLSVSVVISVAQRVKFKMRAQHEYPEHAKPSPVSEALLELLATAGGIYLSLLLVVSFLKIDLLPDMYIFELKMDLMAFVSLVLALIQPFVFNFFNYLKKGEV